MVVSVINGKILLLYSSELVKVIACTQVNKIS